MKKLFAMLLMATGSYYTYAQNTPWLQACRLWPAFR